MKMKKVTPELPANKNTEIEISRKLPNDKMLEELRPYQAIIKLSDDEMLEIIESAKEFALLLDKTRSVDAILKK